MRLSLGALLRQVVRRDRRRVELPQLHARLRDARARDAAVGEVAVEPGDLRGVSEQLVDDVHQRHVPHEDRALLVAREQLLRAATEGETL